LYNEAIEMKLDSTENKSTADLGPDPFYVGGWELRIRITSKCNRRISLSKNRLQSPI